MAYNYYCTNCGQLISQETVLFNMQNLVLEDDSQSFETFSMYMTLEQINNLIARGTLLESGYRQIRLSFTEVMQIISGYWNLNKPELASLTLEQIQEYLRPAMEEGPVVKQPKKKKTGGLNFAMKSVMVETDVDEEEEEEAAPAKAEPKEIPPAVQALSSLWGGMAGDQTVEQKIRGELELLQKAFGDKDFIEIPIIEDIEKDDRGENVVVGYRLINKSGNHKTYRLRTCPKCHRPIYEHAGRAEHRIVVFMGTPESGKTSAILAMTHFLSMSLDPIWKNYEHVDYSEFKLLDENHELLSKELADFPLGIAPKRTDPKHKDDAYSATFWFSDKSGSHLLTLTDMPGEMMAPEAHPDEINEEGLNNTHQAALRCDAYVICFDATTVFRSTSEEGGDEDGQEVRSNAKKQVRMLVEKLNKLQKLRQNMIREKEGSSANLKYVPTLVMITKDATLEQQTEKPETKSMIPSELLYCFQAEREFIQSNRVYNYILETLSESRELCSSYHAMMRCSPFGYAAPNRLDIQKDNLPYHAPSPKNVDEAIKWILKLVGILPAPGELITDEGPLTCKDKDYRLTRAQYRSENPKEGEELAEALSRCTLFENPGRFDEQVLEAHTEGFFAKLRLKIAMMNKRTPNHMDPR